MEGEDEEERRVIIERIERRNGGLVDQILSGWHL